jgi:hypothetical protein
MARARLAVAACAVLLVTGCSDRAVDVRVPTTHPANPDAAAAPPPEPSMTLAIHPGTPGEGVLFPPHPLPGQTPDAADPHAGHHHHDAEPAPQDAPAGAAK